MSVFCVPVSFVIHWHDVHCDVILLMRIQAGYLYSHGRKHPPEETEKKKQWWRDALFCSDKRKALKINESAKKIQLLLLGQEGWNQTDECQAGWTTTHVQKERNKATWRLITRSLMCIQLFASPLHVNQIPYVFAHMARADLNITLLLMGTSKVEFNYIA